MPEIVNVTNANRKGLSILLFFIVLLILILIVGKTPQPIEIVIYGALATVFFLLAVILFLCPIKKRTT